MKILALGLDKSALDSASPLAQRLIKYGQVLDRYDLLVPDSSGKSQSPSEKVHVYGSGGGAKLVQLIRLKWLAAILILRNHYDLISVQDQHYLGLLAWMLARFFGLGLEVQVHGWEKRSGLRLAIAKFLIGRADSIRVVSARLKNDIVNNFCVQPEKITVVPIFVDKPAGELPPLKQCNPDKFVFLTVGRLVPVKNIGLQIEAIWHLHQKFPQAELWIVGEGREKNELEQKEKENYERVAANFEIGKKVKFLGWLDAMELERIYNQADCFLLTSNEEGYGLVAVEAARHGLPIIMTDVGLAGEFIKNQESCLVVKPYDSETLQKYMAEIMSNQDLAKKLGENARRAAWNLPDLKTNLQLYKQSWQRAAAASGFKIKKLLREHGFYLAMILAVAAVAVIVRFTFLPFTTAASDSVQYMETARYFLGQNAVVYPQRILKPLAPFGIGLLSSFTAGNMETALLAESAIFYLLLGLAIYCLLYLFFKDKKSAMWGAIVYISSYPLLKFGLDLYTETGANFFWVLSIISIWFYYQKPTRWQFYFCNFIVMLGLLWKEYSLLGTALLCLVIMFHPAMPRPEKIKKIILSAALVCGWLILIQLVVFANYHYSYLNWYHAGTDISEGTDYHPYFIIKSLVAVYLLGWGLVLLGLKNWSRFSQQQRFFIKCLILPSMMFLLWTGVSSRLYFVVAPLLTLLAVQGLGDKRLQRPAYKLAAVSVIVAGNFYWLFANDIFRSLIQMSQWR